MQRKLRRRLADEEIGDEVFMPTSTIPIPIGKNREFIIQHSKNLTFGYVG